jgi:hypothetical protein
MMQYQRTYPKTGGLPRRLFLQGMGAAAAALVSSQAWAGSYLDRAALLVSQATRDANYLRSRLSDEELARVIHRLAVARVKSASTMHVPKEVAQAHPHLLLTLENFERAASAAEARQAARFYTYVQRAREELAVFRGVLKQLGWSLPEY